MFLLFAGPAFALEINQAIQEHETLAKKYTELAKSQDAFIADQEQILKDYKEKFYINEKLTPLWNLQKLEKQTQTLIRTTQSVKNQYLDLVRWHKSKIAELQGK
jgi:uncharacterized protein YecA (UPF0149 family)